MASHKLQITYDEATDELTVVHRATADPIDGHVVSHAEVVELTDAESMRDALKSMLETNRGEMEVRTGAHALKHAAALSGAAPPNTTRLTVGGSVGPTGSSKTERLP